LAGTLYLCATPIGNMADVTLRVLDVLRSVDVVAAEDTRQTRKLLSHYGISASVISYHEHNKSQAGERIRALLMDGKNVALVTDAGMPAISDPGQELAASVIDSGLSLEVIPGPSASLTALVLSGLPTDRFAFEGFLPRKGQERADRLAQLQAESRTMIIYESPQRLVSTLQDLADRLGGDRPCSLSRELTKKFEETIRGTIDSVRESLLSREIKGECVLVVAGASGSPQQSDADSSLEARPELLAMVRAYADALVSEGASRRDAAQTIAGALGCSWRQVYRNIAAIRE
jgi:16S rRNA (cytidine1402-2'-O)-methyltransferase